LGFQQRALVEGWGAVNTDPTNFSAHRFLADSYSVLPRHKIARVSELLQSQLLQPTNITPIQPRLAESNQFLVAGQGPASLSFNEFNPIFNRNRIAVQGTGLLAEDDTKGGEGIVSGIYKGLSFSAGYSYFDTDGWRKNADQNDKVANVFAQYELTYQTSIQAEFRYRDEDRGDLQQKFFEDEFFPELTDEVNNKLYRVGGKHAFSPRSILIGNFSYQDQDATLTDTDPPDPVLNFVKFDGEFDAYSGELQHLFRSQYFNTVVGAGYFNIDGDDVTASLETVFPPPFDAIENPLNLDVNHYNYYLYSYIKPWSNLTFTLGGSFDDFDTDSDTSISGGDQDQFNPKFGITWNPFPFLTLRGAAFRVFKRTLITDQTLEPTQVAGFNQFYDEINGTDSWRYGGALDLKIKENIYLGGEFAYRSLNTPQIDLLTGEDLNSNDEEYFGRGYLFFTPHDWFSIRGEYLYEKFERDVTDSDFPVELDTHRVPVGFNFFHPSGLSASLTGTYVYQDGDFIRVATGAVESDDDDFILVDAAINYRLPKRHGLLTVGVTNLTDEDFNYWELDFQNPTIQPERSFFANITLAFP
jgi:hypothetical protein